MKNSLRYAVVAVGLTSGAAMAQEQVTIPLSSPGQTATVKVDQIGGSLTVVAGQAGQVVISSSSKTETRVRGNVPAGMHRIGGSSSGVEAVEDHNTVTISGQNGGWPGGALTIQVPANSNLRLESVNGKIEVTGVNGDLEVEGQNGSVTMQNVSGSVVAHSQNGSVNVTLDRVAAGKPMSFSSQNGKVEVTLPADTKAKLRLKSDNGAIYSDFDVKLEPDAAKAVVQDSRSSNGKYKVTMDHNVYGSINGGGPEFRFETLNGNILIHKK